MEQNSRTDCTSKKIELPLFPLYFRNIGIILLFTAFIPFVIIKLAALEVNQVQAGMLKYLGFTILILGLNLIAFAKQKKENNIISVVRLRSIIFAFYFAVFAIIAKPLSDILLNNPIEDMSGQDIIFSMLIVYFLSYYLQIRTVKSV